MEQSEFIRLFQFHIGMINPRMSMAGIINCYWFQFHIGMINP